MKIWLFRILVYWWTLPIILFLVFTINPFLSKDERLTKKEAKSFFKTYWSLV